ncbi:hypothetical protein [Gaoshiqia sediminis]|uniref:Uncharacterized protein n=1 Tax=Gaoshiqia sediminis TaxID=2986998 RepID=A0AA42C9T8_9BACT|nr:hypothetical protein [Gaoshiqia sediminis]MCW0482570.1 hypothetical protein [Gaoshiqia sediminis]
MDKQYEKQILLQFADLYGEFPKGKLVAGESPDFLLKIKPRKAIGIELTELKGQDFLNHTGSLIEPQNALIHIEHTIRAKEEKLYLYRKKKLYQLWLLIHLNSLSPGINFRLSNKLNKLNFNSGFDRIFLIELARERLYELLSD